jgi:peptidoglycan/xylan/chitin deacetylase (PgdA/CDA1 family)
LMYRNGGRVTVYRSQKLSRREFLKGLGAFGSALFFEGQGYSLASVPLVREDIKEPGRHEDPTALPEQDPVIGAVDVRMFQFLISHEVRRGDRNRNVVLMTYDDQGYRSWIEKLLDVYKAAGAKASFFFTGDNLLLYSDQVKRIVDEGHVFGSHGLIHEPHTALNSEEIRAHLREWLGMAREIVPDYQVRYFRFPYGDRNDRVRSVIAEFGLQSVHWTIESGGLDKDTYDNVVGKVSKGSIVLGHMCRYYDVEYAERILEYLTGEGYSLESLETGREARDKYPQKRRPSRPGYPEPRELCLKE